MVLEAVHLIHTYFWLKVPLLPQNFCHIHLIHAKLAVSTDYFCTTFGGCVKDAKVAVATDYFCTTFGGCVKDAKVATGFKIVITLNLLGI